VSTRTSAWPPGTPCWVDLASPDLDAAAEFYPRLLGWQVRTGPPEAGGYRLAMLGGSVVAGLRPSAGPPAWTTYLASADVAATLERVAAAGGRVTTAPVALLSEGALALAEDPTGVPFGIWEPGRLIGAQLVNEPGAFCWDELLTADAGRSRDFHARVFGFAYDDRDGADFSYALIRLGEATVGGLATIGPPVGAHPSSRPQWLVYFSVDDTDGVSARAEALGGRVVVAPTDSPHGRMALLTGPTGELFGVLQADDLPRETPPA
jgi:predicted enzyme related to lactoylglutathione lyase